MGRKKFEAKLKKSCLFHQSKVGFKSYIIFYNGLSMSSKKIQIVINWQMPFLLHDITYFLRFANFYWFFIKNNSKTITPLSTTHASKDTFKWDENFVKAFKLLKSAFVIAPILIHAYPSKPFFSWSKCIKFHFSCYVILV